MDWTNVTPRELWDALREAELGKPRAAWEFLSGFTVPKNQTKWTSRLKCNGEHVVGRVYAVQGFVRLMLSAALFVVSLRARLQSPCSVAR
jgi:hypothetical protein